MLPNHPRTEGERTLPTPQARPWFTFPRFVQVWGLVSRHQGDRDMETPPEALFLLVGASGVPFLCRFAVVARSEMISPWRMERG